MITLEEARIQQVKSQKRSLFIFLGALIFLVALCLVLHFVGAREFYISICISALVLFYIAGKTKIIEFIKPKKCEGEVIYFNVHEERIKKNLSTQPGSKYASYSILIADISITDNKGKIRYKSFRYTNEYDKVKAGDTAIVLRFVEKPIIIYKRK